MWACLARALVAACVIGCLIQQMLGGQPLEDVLRTRRTSPSTHGNVQLLEQGFDVKEPSSLFLVSSVLGAELGLLLLLYGGSRLSAACQSAANPPPPSSIPMRWAQICDTSGALTLSRPSWRLALSFAGWDQLRAVSMSCRGLCAEARNDLHWKKLWEHKFGSPCPIPVGGLEVGPHFLAELWRQRCCRVCGKSFRLAHDGKEAVCRMHPGVRRQVNFYPAEWQFSCCGNSGGSEGCQIVGTHAT